MNKLVARSPLAFAPHQALVPERWLRFCDLYNSRNVALTSLVAWAITCFVVAAASLPVPNIGFVQDLGLMLDAGWRYHQGLRPHADYHSPFGPVLGMLFGIPMKLFGPSYGSLRFLPASVSMIIALWTWAVCCGSLRPLSRLLTAVATGAVAGGIYHQGFAPEVLTFATFYNRVSFGLLAIVTLASLLPTCSVDRKCCMVRDISIVISFTLMAFFKANFAVAAVPFALWALVQRSRKRADLIVIGLAWAPVAVFLLAQIGFRPDLMLADLRMAASGRANGVRDLFFPVRNTMANYDFIGLMAIQTVAFVSPIRAWSLAWRPALRILGILWLPGCVGLALTLTQSHGDGRGIILVVSGMAAAFAHRVPATAEPVGPVSHIRNAIGFTTLAFACLLFVIPHAQSYWTLYRVSAQPGPPPFSPGPLRELYVGPYNDLGGEYIPAIREAMDLLSTNCRPGESLQFLGGCNIFAFASGLRSPKHSMLFWCGISTFSERCHPPPEEFKDTDFILCFKDQYFAGTPFAAWQPIYSYYISTHYTSCDEGQYFKLLARRSPTGGSE